MGKAETANEIVSNFIKSLETDASLDPDVVSVIVNLHTAGKLSDKAISNELEIARKKKLDETTKIDS